MDNLLFIDTKIMFSSFYDQERDSFITEIETIHDSIYESMGIFLNKIKDNILPWQKNFFVIPDSFDKFTFCPGRNIEYLLFSDGLADFEKKGNINLYILEWLFSVAVGIYILESNNIEYYGLSDKTVLIDSKMRARIINLTHNHYKNDTITAYPIFFYSPEQSYWYRNNIAYSKISKEQKSKANAYNYGVFLHQLVTRQKQSDIYFNNIPKSDTVQKLEEGAIEYMQLDKRNVPFQDLLLKCLQTDINERCDIKYVIQYLLNIDNNSKSAPSDPNYFNLNSVNLNEYHKFIIEVFGFEKVKNFEDAKQEIISMLNGENQLKNNAFLDHTKCTFEDLEEGYNLGMNYCMEMIKQSYTKLYCDDQKRYKKFREANPEINDFQVMKVFMKYRFNVPQLIDELNKLSRRNTQFSKLILDKQPNIHDDLNLYNILYGYSRLTRNTLNINMKLRWLKSIAEQLRNIYDNARVLITFSSKDVYISENMEAVIYQKQIEFVQKEINSDSIDDRIMELKTRLQFTDIKDKNDISLYYRPPELLEKIIDPENIDFSKCAMYSFGVLAKELIEANTPWLYTENLTKKEKIKMMKNPHWCSFSSVELEKEISKHQLTDIEKENLYNYLNQCLYKDASKRGNFPDLIEILKKITDDNE